MTFTIQLLGAPGCGKSTIASYLEREFNAPCFAEPFELNEYIPQLAVGMPVAALCQERMLQLTNRQENDARYCGAEIAIIDGGLDQTRAFIEALFHMGKLTASEYITLHHSYRLLSRPIDLTIHLQARGKVMLERVRSRGRAFEKGYSKSYLKTIRNSLNAQGHIAVDANQELHHVKFDCQLLVNQFATRPSPAAR